MKATLRECDQIAKELWESFKRAPIETVDTLLILGMVRLLVPTPDPDLLSHPDLPEVTIE